MSLVSTYVFFSQDVINILPNSIKEHIDPKLCRMFSVGADAFQYYNVLSLMPGKRTRDFYKCFCNNRTQEFFINMLRYIKDNGLVYQDTISFVVGYVCHYAFDITINPYFIYKTGIFDRKKRNTYQFNSLDNCMGTFIDKTIIFRNINTNEFNISKYIFDNYSFSKHLNNTIDYAFYNTFHLNNMSSKYYKSLKHMRRFINVFRYDKYGIKWHIYRLIDSLTPNNFYKFSALSYSACIEDYNDFFNYSHSTWRNPSSYKITSSESFDDLYIKASLLAKTMICACFDYIHHRDIDLEKIFDNSSYINGLNCELSKDIKYFEL